MNYAHGRQDHLFGKRYDDTPVESDTHLLEVCRYVVLNPVRAGICVDPSEWPWSSFRATAGLELSPSWLAAGDVLRLFAAEPEAARSAYAAFVREGHVRCQAPVEVSDAQPARRP